jgi:uncharacterized protein
MSGPARVEALLIVGGRLHDFDFARLELLKLLADHPRVRVGVAADYRDVEALARSRFLVSYTCDVRPSEPEQAALGRFALVAGIGAFDTDDELYLSEYHDSERLIPLLDTSYRGTAGGFVESDWSAGGRLVSYVRPLGRGAVLYNTLGHCRGHWDMRPVMDWYARVERCSWELPQYHELLGRGVRWALGEID